MNTIVVILENLTNEYSSKYGEKYHIFASTKEEGERWIGENFTEEERYRSRDVWGQLHFEIISAEDRAYTSFFILLKSFGRKDIGPSVLKQIGDIGNIWEHNSYMLLYK